MILSITLFPSLVKINSELGVVAYRCNLIPGRLRQEDREFQVSLGCIADWLVFVNLTLWKKEPQTEKLHLTHWPVDMPVGYFLDG